MAEVSNLESPQFLANRHLPVRGGVRGLALGEASDLPNPQPLLSPYQTRGGLFEQSVQESVPPLKLLRPQDMRVLRVSPRSWPPRTCLTFCAWAEFNTVPDLPEHFRLASGGPQGRIRHCAPLGQSALNRDNVSRAFDD